MGKYDFNLAKKTIQKYSDLLEEASLGMAEDWFWTAESVYSDGTFKVNLEEDNLTIAGIDSSSWATPTLHLVFKDGKGTWLDCYEGEVDISNKPEWLELGVLSEDCQKYVDVSRGKFLENTEESE